MSCIWRSAGRAAGLPKRLGRCLSGGVLPHIAMPSSASGSSRRSCASTSRSSQGGTTALGAYLERCGAVWGEAYEVEGVQASEDGRRFAWRVECPPERLAALRHGDPLESPTFPLPGGCRARFQLFPKGDSDCSDEGSCSLWLCTDSQALGKIRLKLGGAEQSQGASQFCRLSEALAGDAIDVSLQLEEAEVQEPPVAVEQSLRLTDLKMAEWQLFSADRLLRTGSLISSPPFRFHHVLLGDMYLELLPGVPHPEHCTLFFRCRVPTMQLRVELAVGSAFSKSIIGLGRSTPEADLKAGQCLQVNLGAPGVLDPDGSLTVRCSLEEVVAIPAALREMIPKLDERANWPKRI
mmetsp:Transcript_17470/g.31021  ORF Transcript_17470/g.31021 Transcript_17470/m.31021 type:complete len:351 (-) Transcript_17470:42-1094(-)